MSRPGRAIIYRRHYRRRRLRDKSTAFIFMIEIYSLVETSYLAYSTSRRSIQGAIIPCHIEMHVA